MSTHQNQWNICRCVCGCMADTPGPEFKLCHICIVGDARRHFVQLDASLVKEFAPANGFNCRHENVYFGRCSFCGVRVETAAGGAI
jgi:hypothetical protein